MESVKDFLAVDFGSGHGYGSGSGDGDIKCIFGKAVHVIDGVPTLIDRVRFGYAVGHILNSDLTLTPCLVAKSGNYFAHGRTLREAQNAVTDKVLENKTEEERIDAFWACHTTDGRYRGQDLYDWHHRLTGSCEMGRQRFIKDKGLSIDAEYTVKEFVEICKDAYGGSTIRRLADRWED